MKSPLRRGFGSLVTWSAFAVVVLGCSETRRAEDSTLPLRAVVLVSVDTLRPDHLGVYGHERFTSPVLDAFAAEGVAFDDVSATAAWTLPSHASMLTGLFPVGHGVMGAGTALSDEVGTLAGWFAEAGWDTAAAVNVIWLKKDRYGLTRDFEKYLSIDDPDYRRRAPSTWITDQAMAWLEDQGDRPLFVFVHYYDVHADYASLPEYERLLVGEYSGVADGTAWQIERASFVDEHVALCLEAFDPSICQFGSSEKPRRIDAEMERVEFEEADVAHLEQLYDAGIRQLDTELGRLLAFMGENGRLEDSIVVVTSDHGEEFMEHGRLAHFLTTYQESLRVPLLMRGAGIPPGRRVKTPVSLVDLAPTLLGLAGIEPPSGLDGKDFSSLWKGGSPDFFTERYLYGEASGGLQHEEHMPGVYPTFRSIRQGRFKLVESTQGTETEYELYDVQDDPGETNDLARLEEDRAAALARELGKRPARPGESIKAGKEVELDAAEIDRLRALGYVP